MEPLSTRRPGPAEVAVSILRSPARAIVAINIAIFALMVITGVSPFSPERGELLSWGANFSPLTSCGQQWRLLTSLFIHIGLMHLAFNMWILWSYGPIAEVIYGRVGFVLLYFGAGTAASVASTFWHPQSLSAGASGAIFGVVGAMIAAMGLSLRRGSPTGPLVAFVVYNVIFGLTVPAIDNAAHMGGLVGGWACGKLLGPQVKLGGMRVVRPPVRFLLPVFLAVALAAAPGYFADEEQCVEGKLYLASASAKNGEVGAAIKEVAKLVREKPENARIRAELGRLLAVAGEYEQALMELEVAAALDPVSPEILGLTGYCLANVGRLEEAVSVLEEAVELAPDDRWVAELLAQVKNIAQEQQNQKSPR